MKNAYALLGLLFVLLIAGTYFFVRGGGEDSPSFTNDNLETMGNLKLTSSAFEHNGTIPSKYTCDGENSNPPLEISNVPAGTQSLVLLMDDPDIPQVFKEQRGIDDFDHWALVNIAPTSTSIPEDAAPEGGVVGVNSAGSNTYTGPCPPTEYEPTEHRYIFKLYALDTVLGLQNGVTHEEILSALEGHVLEQAELIGLYDRAN